jgi:hypothetical protein
MQLSGFGGCATIASRPGTRHMNAQRRPVTVVTVVTATVKLTVELTAKADFKENAIIAVGKVTKLTTVGRKKRTKKSVQSGIKTKRPKK